MASTTKKDNMEQSRGGDKKQVIKKSGNAMEDQIWFHLYRLAYPDIYVTA